MKYLIGTLRRLLFCESGVATVEYAVILALILIVILTSAELLGCRANLVFLRASNALK